MNTRTNVSLFTLQAALKGLELNRTHLEAEMRANRAHEGEILQAMQVLNGASSEKTAQQSKTNGKRHMSVQGRKNVVAALKRRWDAYHAAKKMAAAGPQPIARSAATRKRMAQAQKKRWAAEKKMAAAG